MNIAEENQVADVTFDETAEAVCQDASPETELRGSKDRQKEQIRVEEKTDKRVWVESSGNEDSAKERVAVRAVFQPLGKMNSPRAIELTRNRKTRCQYAALALTEGGKTHLIQGPQSDFSAKNLHETLMSAGVDCPSSRQQTYAVISRHIVEGIDKEVKAFFVSGADTETGEIVYDNGLVHKGDFYSTNESGLVELRDGEFALIATSRLDPHHISSRFEINEFSTARRTEFATSMLNDLQEMFGQDFLLAFVLLQVRRRILPKEMADRGFGFNTPILYFLGQRGAGKTTVVKYLSEVIFGVEDGKNASGGSFPALRNRLCSSRFPIHIEEAHQPGNPVSLVQGPIADLARKLYSGGDFSHANESFRPEGFLINDGISTDSFNLDILDRLFTVEVPKLPESSESLELRNRVQLYKKQLRFWSQEKDSRWSEDPSAWRECFFAHLKSEVKGISENFGLAGRAAWPAMLIAGSKMLWDDELILEQVRNQTLALIEKQRSQRFPLTLEFLERVCTCREQKKVRFNAGSDEYGHVHVDSPARIVVKIVLSSCLSFLKASDANSAYFVGSHLQRELGLPEGVDKDPLLSELTWIRRNRDKSKKTLGGSRFLQFDLNDPSMPADIRDVLNRLAAPSWPNDYVDAQHSAKVSAELPALEAVK